jgi:NAD+ synthase
MDLCLLGKNKGFSPEEVAPVAELSPEQVSRVYKDIDNKRKFTRYLHLAPLLIEEVKEI